MGKERDLKGKRSSQGNVLTGSGLPGERSLWRRSTHGFKIPMEKSLPGPRVPHSAGPL